MTEGFGCCVLIGWAAIVTANFVCFSYQYGGKSRSTLEQSGSPANRRCMVVGKLRHVRLLDDNWQTAPNHSRPTSCVGEADIDTRGSAGAQSAKRAMMALREQQPCNLHSERCDRVRIMTLRTNAVSLAAGTPVAARALIVQHDRRGLRGKNGSARG